METVAYQIESELDFHRITSALEDANIPYTFKKYSDSTFPALGINKVFGEISVSSVHDHDLKTWIRELTNTEPKLLYSKTAAKSRKGKSNWTIALIAYAVVISVLCFKYWFFSYRNAQDKNNRFEWSADGQDLMMINKETGKITHRYTDANYDLNFEESRMFSKDGVNIAEFKDQNEDGVYEIGFLYNLNREPIGAQFDRDNDGIFEELLFILENGDTVKLLDSNRNGFLEIQK